MAQSKLKQNGGRHGRQPPKPFSNGQRVEYVSGPKTGQQGTITSNGSYDHGWYYSVRMDSGTDLPIVLSSALKAI